MSVRWYITGLIRHIGCSFDAEGGKVYPEDTPGY